MDLETLNKYLPLTLSEKDRLRRAMEFINSIEEAVPQSTFEAIWEKSIKKYQSNWCEQCGAALKDGKVQHQCNIVTCPYRPTIFRP